MRVGIDIGGTFTDVVMFDERSGQLTHAKTLSTPSEPEAGFMHALAAIGAPIQAVTSLVHGTTIVTNLILERKGARVALITTKGFRDVLEIMRATRPLPYDLAWRKPTPLVPRALCFEVDERIDAAGNVVRPIDPDDVRQVVDTVLATGVDSVAVCLLHAYLNDRHERVIEQILRERRPDLSLSISAEVCREIREYERANTTVVNAYAMPRVEHYVAALDRRIERPGLVRYLSSEGGLQPSEEAAARPVSLCVSGPAGGVMGSQFAGGLIGRRNLITIDMGGTSFDVAVIRDGRLELRTTFEVGWGLPVKAPTIDIKTIGAGGGSIVWIDEGGALRVGPHSAGATPGPACYGRGGTECTVTDANLVLGLINPDGLLPMDAAKAEQAVQPIARHFGLSVTETAAGIYRVVNANMAAAIRQMTVEKGIDPREFTLLAFGGAGGQHAAVLAEEVGIPEVVAPAMASVFSAFGMVNAPPKISRAAGLMRPLNALDPAALHRVFKQLETEIRSRLDDQDCKLEYGLDLRYLKQAHEIAVVVRPDWAAAQIAAAFEERHHTLYGTRLGHPLMVVTARLTATSAVPPLEPARRTLKGRAVPAPVRLTALAGVGAHVPVYDRATLPPEVMVAGPCLIEERDTSFYMPPGAVGQADSFGNLIVRSKTGASAA
jgi:N-methylhydantoinase A